MKKGPKCKCGRDTYVAPHGLRMRNIRFCSGCSEPARTCTCKSVKPDKKK